ncbi:MAG: RecX family transcriptional regulator [Bacilli bacterium]|nr:RecX family transcriptional regulator [Bacilli bacterium]
MKESCMSTEKQSATASEEYVIQDVQILKDGVHLYINSKEIVLSLDCYLSDYFYPGKRIDKKQYAELKKMEKQSKERKYLLFLLGHGRYTTYEIKTKMKGKYHLSEKDCQEMIQPYVESGVLDDREYVLDFIESKTEQGYGKGYLVDTLKKKGIPSSLLESKEVEEMMKADLELLQSLIEKEDKKKTGLPMKKRKERLSLFLHRRGFSSSMINDAIETFFSSQSEEKRQNEDENSYLLLKKQALKCYNSFVRKYSEPKKRKQAFIQYFLRRGYDYSDLEELIQQEGLSFND